MVSHDGLRSSGCNLLIHLLSIGVLRNTSLEEVSKLGTGLNIRGSSKLLNYSEDGSHDVLGFV